MDTFTCWVEAFCTRKEKALEVVQKLLIEIIPWFGFLLSLQSDN